MDFYRDENEKSKIIIDLDEQERQEINYVLYQSQISRHSAVFHMFGGQEELAVNGVVEFIDSYQKRFKVEGEWFPVEDIMHASLQ